MATRTEFVVRIDQFQARRISMELALKLVRRTVREISEGASAILSFGPYTTGRMARHVKTRISLGAYIIEGQVGVDGKIFPYAASVEGGARRHYIPKVPKGKGRWLRFYWRRVGHVVYAKQVNHPGQTGKAFLRIPMLEVCPRLHYKVFIYDV
jgi:hypothetical protein